MVVVGLLGDEGVEREVEAVLRGGQFGNNAETERGEEFWRSKK